MAVEIAFNKDPGTRYHSILKRLDGVTVRLEGGSWNRIGGGTGRLPHDVAHMIVERELAYVNGLWGVLLRGGMLQNASIVDGRRSPDAAGISEAVIAPAREDLRRIEIVVRAVADLSLESPRPSVDAFNALTGDRWRTPISAGSLATICAQMAAESERWQDDTVRYRIESTCI